MKPIHVAHLFLAAAAAAAQPAAAVPLHIFDSVVSAPSGSPGGTDPISRRPSIADTGAVVFAERYLDGATVRERIRVVAEDGVSRIVADEASLPLDLDFATNPVISDDGTYVSFIGADDVGRGVWRADLSAPTTTYTRIVREGDVIPGETQTGNSTYATASGLACGSGCPVADATGTKFDGRVLFRTDTTATALSAGSGGVPTPIANRYPSEIREIAQSDQGETAIYSWASFPTGIDYTTNSQIGLGNPLIRSTTSDFFHFNDLAVVNQSKMGTNLAIAATAFRFLAAGGGSVIIANDATSSANVFSAIVDADGPYEAFRDVSINRAKGLLFEADLDLQGSGIFTGANVAEDRVIGVGDVLFGQTVVAVGLQKGEALNEDGEVTFWVELSDGSQHIATARSFAKYLANLGIQMSIPKGGSLKVAQTLQGAFPSTAFDLIFAPDFLTGEGSLDVSLGGISLASLRPASVPADGIFRVAGIDPTPFQRILDSGGMLDLIFDLAGPGNSTIRLDDIGLLSDGRPLGLIRNGDFETGYLDGWGIETSGDATAFLKAVPTAPVPLPAGGVLLVSAMFATIAVKRFRRTCQSRSPL